MSGCVRYIFILMFIICIVFKGYAQQEKKLSLNLMAGAAFLSKSEKIAPSGLPENIFGGYKIGLGGGLGVNFRLSEKMQLFENVSFFHSSKPNYGFSLNTFKTGLKYNILSREKRFSPFVAGSIDLALVFLNRAKNIRDVFPDSTANSIGTGFGATKITYNEEQLKLSAVPTAGTSLGAGIDIRLSPKFTLFLLYTFNYNLAKQPKLLKDNYFYNQSNLTYSMASVGITMRMFKKVRQLLATLPKEQWEGDNTASLKGTIIYKKPDSQKKEEVVEMTNQKDSTLQTLETDKDGLFKIPNLPRNDYKFYLAKRNKKIDKADIELIHDNRLKLTDDYLSLEMFDEMESENFISREGNYSVVLREGFQHEISLSITGMSINGKLDNFAPDTSCQNVQILLYDKRDSLIKVTTPMADCSFKFTDLPPGGYRMAFRNTNPKQNVSFTYSFTSQPVVSRQFNSVAPKIIYFIAGQVTLADSVSGGSEVLVRLIDPVSKVVKDTVLTKNGKFHFDNLSSDKYAIVYDADPKIKGDLVYTMDNNESSYHKEYSYHFGETVPDTTARYTAQGKLTTLKPDHSYVYLVGKDNDIKAKVRPAPDGTFSFNNLPSQEYKVVYEVEDTNVTAKLQYGFNDSSSGEETIVLSAKGTKRIGVTHKIKAATPIVPAGYKVVRYNASNFKNLESGKTYDSKGHIVKLEGFGVQIASYIGLENMIRQYTKIQNDGITDAYIQVVTLQENGKAVKYYRIVVGSHADLNDLRKREMKLKENGFSTTFRKHL
jgi:hypothetical protein